MSKQTVKDQHSDSIDVSFLSLNKVAMMTLVEFWWIEILFWLLSLYSDALLSDCFEREGIWKVREFHFLSISDTNGRHVQTQVHYLSDLMQVIHCCKNLLEKIVDSLTVQVAITDELGHIPHVSIFS